jgi:hypothetical protein
MTHNMSFLCSDTLFLIYGLPHIIWTACIIAWTACVKTPEKLVPRLISQLRQIDFDQLERHFQEWKITPEGWSEFLRWLYRHDRQNHWFRRINDVGFVGKRRTLAVNEPEDEIDRDEGEERRMRRRIQPVDIHGLL